MTVNKTEAKASLLTEMTVMFTVENIGGLKLV